ncbi:MAG TPA: hypothetical protein VGV59_19600 [Pyrinomonadaceae bacterium]|nr:hypothetical protein [Pyrinomonadaceae bacterium]
MRCPGCGTETASEQKFCRLCGTNLEAIAKASSAHPSVGDPAEASDKTTRRMHASRQKRPLFRGLIIILLGVTVLANAEGRELVNWLGIAAFLAGMALAIYGVFAEDKPQSPDSAQTFTTKALDESGAHSYLPPQNPAEPVPSVSERTTELLESKKHPPRSTPPRR